MATKPPFMNSTGLIPRILNKITEAQKPERFTQDFLGTKLGFSSGSARAVIPLLKKIGFLQPDGAPTDLYSKFRNPSERGRAMAQAIRTGYKDVFERNEYAQDLAKEKLRGLIVEITGLKRSSRTVNAIVGTFKALKEFADFKTKAGEEAEKMIPGETAMQISGESLPPAPLREGRRVGVNLSYTINLNLPETTNVEVFNAIFKSLRENLLKE